MPQSLDNLSTTWNSAGTTFTALKFNVTDTASQAGSLLLDLQTGGVSRFRVSKAGRVDLSSNLATTSYIETPNVILNFVAGTGVSLAPSSAVGWGSSGAAFGSDLLILRDAAQTLAQRNGTNAQTFRVYNTFTSDTNFERGKIEWASNVLRIGTEKGSLGGTARALELQTDGTTRLTIAAGGGGTYTGIFTASALASGDYVECQRLNFPAKGSIKYESDGIVSIRDAATTGFGRLQFGGTTSSFPAIKRSGTMLQARLADDSGFATLDGILSMEGTAPTVTGDTGTAGELRYDANYLYVCTAANTWKRVAIATW